MHLRPVLPLVLAILAATASVIVVEAASSDGQHRRQSARASAVVPHASRSRQDTAHAIGRAVGASLTPRQLAGQRVIYAYSGATPPRSLLARIRNGEAAGVIIFGPNIASAVQLRSAIREMQRANAESGIHVPLLVMTDQEGGQVQRLPWAPSLSEKQIGMSPHASALAAQAGAGAARTLDDVGVNVNLAPVLDVYRQPGGFIDGYERSYAKDPFRVAELGGAFITALQRHGVAATAKHFPGLGAASSSQDTDEGPVTLNLSVRAIRATDELPYRRAIADRVRLVMVSWATYPALDPNLPAGLSATVIQGELRGRLGYRGVTITDGISAGALRRFGAPAQRGVLAASAGADLLLCSARYVDENSPAEGTAVLAGVADAIARGEISRASAEQAAMRVLALRASLAHAG